MSDRVPLTGVGWLVAGTAVVSYLAGWQLGWIELMIVAAGAAVALAIAVPFVVGRSALAIDREIEPNRVMVGDTAAATLVARAGSRPTRGVRVDDAIGDEVVPVDVPGLLPGAEHVAVYPLPTDRRRRVDVGPAAVTRRDPLELMRRQVAHAPATELWVHPRWSLVPSLPIGFAKDLEGPTSDASPIGDVAFHTLRSYEIGDDRRHIHWMSTARAGTPMVRHYVDNRRPVLAVHLDDEGSFYDADQFEVAVEIATSLLLSSLAHDLPAIGRCGERWLAGRTSPATRDQLLERLTTVETVRHDRPDTALAVATMQMIGVERAASAVALVVGSRPSASVLPAVTRLSKRVRVIVIGIDAQNDAPGDGFVRLPGARVIRAQDRETFAAAWTAMVRR